MRSMMKFNINYFFFFSSRRRHTRCSRDWSSDVCSSDLVTDGVGRQVDAWDPVGEAGGVFRVVVTARRAPAISKEALRRWPKAELHVHLDGSLRPSTMLELARGQHVRLPAGTPAGLTPAPSGAGAPRPPGVPPKY